MTWNMLQMARMLKDNGGFPGYGNSTHDWNLEQSRAPEPRVPVSQTRPGGMSVLRK